MTENEEILTGAKRIELLLKALNWEYHYEYYTENDYRIIVFEYRNMSADVNLDDPFEVVSCVELLHNEILYRTTFSEGR